MFKENLRLKKILKKRILEIKGIFLQNYMFPDFAFQIIIIHIKSRSKFYVLKEKLIRFKFELNGLKSTAYIMPLSFLYLIP